MVKVRLYLGVVMLVMVTLMFGACSEIVGGPCKYVDIPGNVRIVSVKEAVSTESNCKNAVEVIFDFVPLNPAIPGRPDSPGARGTPVRERSLPSRPRFVAGCTRSAAP